MVRWDANVWFRALAWWVRLLCKTPCADLRQLIGHEADLGPSVRRDRTRAPMREVTPLGPDTTPPPILQNYSAGWNCCQALLAGCGLFAVQNFRRSMVGPSTVSFSSILGGRTDHRAQTGSDVSDLPGTYAADSRGICPSAFKIGLSHQHFCIPRLVLQRSRILVLLGGRTNRPTMYRLT